MRWDDDVEESKVMYPHIASRIKRRSSKKCVEWWWVKSNAWLITSQEKDLMAKNGRRGKIQKVNSTKGMIRKMMMKQQKNMRKRDERTSHHHSLLLYFLQLLFPSPQEWEWFFNEQNEQEGMQQEMGRGTAGAGDEGKFLKEEKKLMKKGRGASPLITGYWFLRICWWVLREWADGA